MSIMGGQSRDKLKSVLTAVPPWFLVDSAWLGSQDVGRRSAYAYVKSGWLERVHRGVYRRPPATGTTKSIDWKTCLLSVQHIMNYRVHIGGMSALALQGFSHYLSLGKSLPVWVYGDDIPTWLGKLPLNAEVTQRTTSLFDDPALGVLAEKSAQTADTPGETPWGWSLRMSSPERAILETLDELPQHESFHNVDVVFEGLAGLRPRQLAPLLRSCRKIKVRRLFFVFADRHKHAWRKHLNAEDFDLGSGDRALVTGGKIHPTYRIMVPTEFVTSESEPADGP
jgi:hypothetical protein